MNDPRWPTHQEMTEYVDGAIDPQRFLEIDQLAKRSSALRNEIALLKKMRESIGGQIIATGRNFNHDVMSQIVPQEHGSLWYRLASSSSKVFAMTLVLSLIGIVLFSGPAARQHDRTMVTRAMEVYSSAVTTVLGSIHSMTKGYSQPITQLGQGGTGKFLLMAVGIFFLFAAADEVIGKRYSRFRK